MRLWIGGHHACADGVSEVQAVPNTLYSQGLMRPFNLTALADVRVRDPDIGHAVAELGVEVELEDVIDATPPLADLKRKHLDCLQDVEWFESGCDERFAVGRRHEAIRPFVPRLRTRGQVLETRQAAGLGRPEDCPDRRHDRDVVRKNGEVRHALRAPREVSRLSMARLSRIRRRRTRPDDLGPPLPPEGRPEASRQSAHRPFGLCDRVFPLDPAHA